MGMESDLWMNTRYLCNAHHLSIVSEGRGRKDGPYLWRTFTFQLVGRNKWTPPACAINTLCAVTPIQCNLNVAWNKHSYACKGARPFPSLLSSFTNMTALYSLHRNMPPQAVLMEKTKDSGSKLRAGCALFPKTGKGNSPEENKTH